MKTWKLMGLGSIAGLLAGFAGSQAGDFIMAKRFMVAHTPEKTSAVLMSESDGAGRFIVYDAAGKEAFFIKGGEIGGDLFTSALNQPTAAAMKDLEDIRYRLAKLEVGRGIGPAADTPVKPAAPSEPPTPKDDRLPKLQTAIDLWMEQDIIAKIDFNAQGVWIRPVAWSAIDAGNKKNLVMVVAEYVKLRRGSSSMAIDVFDAQSGKKIAAYGDILGYRVF